MAPAPVTLSQQDKLVHQKVLSSRKKSMSEDVIVSSMPAFSAMKIKNSIHQLMKVNLLKAVTNKDGNLVFHAVDRGEALKVQDLNGDQRSIYAIISQSGVKGISKPHIMSTMSDSPRHVVSKALDQLEKSGLIKQFKGIATPTVPLYILATVQPAEDVAGGIWYNDGKEYDDSFVTHVRQAILGAIRKTVRSRIDTDADGQVDAQEEHTKKLIMPVSKVSRLHTPSTLLELLNGKWKKVFPDVRFKLRHVLEITRLLELDGEIEAIKPTHNVVVTEAIDSDDDDDLRPAKRHKGSDDSDIDEDEKERRAQKEKDKKRLRQKERERERKEQIRREKKQQAKRKKEKERERVKEKKRKLKAKKRRRHDTSDDSDDSDDSEVSDADSDASDDVSDSDALVEIGETDLGGGASSKKKSKSKTRSKKTSKKSSKSKKRKRRAASSDDSDDDSDSDSDSDSESDASKSDATASDSDNIDDLALLPRASKPRVKRSHAADNALAGVPVQFTMTAAPLSDLTDAAVAFRPLNRIKVSLGQTESPCGKCPQFAYCEEDAPVNPDDCEYWSGWLAGTKGGWNSNTKDKIRLEQEAVKRAEHERRKAAELEAANQDVGVAPEVEQQDEGEYQMEYQDDYGGVEAIED